LAIAHSSAVAVGAAACLVLAANLPKIVESIYRRRPTSIKVKGEAKVNAIRATSEAQALMLRTQVEAELLCAGMEPGKAEQAVLLLRQHSINADLPEGRRLTDDPLSKLLMPPRVKATGTRPDSDPQSVVRPIRQ
jgi:hypothetical protein